MCISRPINDHPKSIDQGLVTPKRIYLGKFIYFIDAYEDIEQDLKKGTYNPFKELYQTDQFEDKCKDILELMISEATMAFERLPIIENAAIIRNILYGGVWNKYELVRQKRLEGRK